MATSDNGSLLSKVVSFVSSPVLRKPMAGESDQEVAERPDKAAIQAMLDRKLHNDVVRKREFELLRQMRKREPQANRIDLNDRTSLFPSSILSRPGGRAQTIKKIDEIEQQMSQQWWKGKQIKSSFHASKHAPLAAASGAAVVAPPVLQPVQAQPPAVKTLALEPLQEDGDTVQGRLESSLYDDPPSVSAYDFPPTQVEQFAYDPAIEDAAIQFANGDFEGAAQSLLELLRTGKGQGDQEDIWMTLFDLYRAMGDHTRFDGAAIDFAARYGRSAPQWGSAVEVKQQVVAPEIAVATVGVGTDWNAPASIDVEVLADLRKLLDAGGEPWRLNWSKLSTIQPAAVPVLAHLFAGWCRQRRQLHFRGAKVLDGLLQAATVAGDADVPQAWWLLRLDSLRLARKEDEFELVALDYCITYEMSPPAWEPALSELRFGEMATTSDNPDSEIEPLKMGEELLTTLAGSLTTSTGPWKTSAFNSVDVQEEISASGFALVELSGEVLGEATEALDKMSRARGDLKKLVVDCRNLVRVDFPAAGNLLNWSSACTAEGCKVEFKNVNRIVATFFSVIGIDEFVRIVVQSH